jgi:hypothetical protein
MKPEYIFGFFKSEFGREQLVRRNRGSMYPAVVGDDVLDVWVLPPTPDVEEEVVTLVQSAIANQDEFFRLHSDARKRLETFLAPIGAPPSPLEGIGTGPHVALVKSSDFFGDKSAKRFDAEFVRSEYRSFDEKVKKLTKTFLLGEYFTLQAGAGLVEGSDKGPTLFLKQAVLTNVGINWSAAHLIAGTPTKGAPKIRKGDTLLACAAHEVYYLGRKVDFVRRIPSRPRTISCVADVMVISPKETCPQNLRGSYLAAVLRNPTGLHQVQRCIRGLRVGHVYASDLAQFVSEPIPDDSWLKEFEALTEQAEDYRNKAKAEVKQAVQTVEAYVKGAIS